MLATDGLLGFLAGHGLSPAELDDERLHDLAMAWACALGSESAVTAFWDAYAELVRNIGARVLPGEALDDFRQHVFTHLLVRRGEAPPRIGYYGGRGPLRAFVRMIASRVAIDTRRAGGLEAVPASDLDGRMLDELDPSAALETVEARALFGEALARALQSLRPPERRALRMRYVLGLSVARTAEALGVHQVSVSRLVTRARARVLERVQHELERIGGAPASEALAALVRSLDLSVARWLRTHVD